MSEGHFSKEKQVIMAMRKTLAKIIRDLTPSDSALRYPLTEETIKDVKMCFDLMAARERELAAESGIEIKDRPHFTDEPRTANVVPIQGLKKKD